MFTESAEFYDAIYSFKDYAAEAAQIAALVRSLSPDARTVLDVACGTGEHVRLLAGVHGFEADGLDLDAALLRLAAAKHPSGRFFEADMSRFSLEQRYDAILCLFSSIAYLVTFDRIVGALTCFRRHLAPAGIVVVEPWFPPGGLNTGRAVKVTGTYRGRKVTRINRNEIDGRVSRLRFDYEIESAEGVQRASEIHELGLFTPDEMGAAFEAAGLTASYDSNGLTGRGLWVARG